MLAICAQFRQNRRLHQQGWSTQRDERSSMRPVQRCFRFGGCRTLWCSDGSPAGIDSERCGRNLQQRHRTKAKQKRKKHGSHGSGLPVGLHSTSGVSPFRASSEQHVSHQAAQSGATRQTSWKKQDQSTWLKTFSKSNFKRHSVATVITPHPLGGATRQQLARAVRFGRPESLCCEFPKSPLHRDGTERIPVFQTAASEALATQEANGRRQLASTWSVRNLARSQSRAMW